MIRLMIAGWFIIVHAFLQMQAGEVNRILFGSCLKQEQPVPIFEAVNRQNPDAFIFLGDNIYADTEDMQVMATKYAKLGAIPGFVKLKSMCPLFATWDDHDYGVNDGGAEYPMRVEAQREFRKFWGEPNDSSLANSPGIYDAVILGEAPRRIQIILLDTRYFRGALKKGERRVGGPYYPHKSDAKVAMLGKAQWTWLEGQLQKPAEIRIICSSIQFISEAAGQETWSNIPGERSRMIELIRETGAKGLFFISGDRHWADLAAQVDDVPYPLYDVTSSGMNQIHKRGTPTENRYRITAKTYHQPNFGQINIDWEKAPVEIKVEIRGLEGRVELAKRFTLDELK